MYTWPCARSARKFWDFDPSYLQKYPKNCPILSSPGYFKKSPPHLLGKVAGARPPTCHEVGGRLFEVPRRWQNGAIFRAFLHIWRVKIPKISRATRARAYIHGYITSLNETAPLIRHKNGYMQKMIDFEGISGFCTKILPEIEFFWGARPLHFAKPI